MGALALGALVTSSGALAAEGAEAPLLAFDSLDGLTCERSYKCVEAKAKILAAGALIGPYYGHDYIDMLGGDWPETLIKLNPARERCQSQQPRLDRQITSRPHGRAVPKAG